MVTHTGMLGSCKAAWVFLEGRPRKHTKQQFLHALELLKTHTYKEVEEMTGIKKRTLINRRNELEAKQL